ncbi:MAG: hypothetical protein ABIN18_29320, partial [Pseudomonadota bacterium]
ACKKAECQRAKKAAWQRHKIKTDPDYKFNQKLCQRQWVEARPGYWRVRSWPGSDQGNYLEC